jgi:hypothetical protein
MKTPTSFRDGARRLSCSESLFGCFGQSLDLFSASSSTRSLRVLSSSLAVGPPEGVGSLRRPARDYRDGGEHPTGRPEA